MTVHEIKPTVLPLLVQHSCPFEPPAPAQMKPVSKHGFACSWTQKQTRASAYIKLLQVQERAAVLTQTAPGCAGQWILQAEKMRSEADVSRRREVTKLRKLSVLLGLDNRTEMTNSKLESLNC